MHKTMEKFFPIVHSCAVKNYLLQISTSLWILNTCVWSFTITILTYTLLFSESFVHLGWIPFFIKTKKFVEKTDISSLTTNVSTKLRRNGKNRICNVQGKTLRWVASLRDARWSEIFLTLFKFFWTT